MAEINVLWPFSAQRELDAVSGCQRTDRVSLMVIGASNAIIQRPPIRLAASSGTGDFGLGWGLHNPYYDLATEEEEEEEEFICQVLQK